MNAEARRIAKQVILLGGGLYAAAIALSVLAELVWDLAGGPKTQAAEFVVTTGVGISVLLAGALLAWKKAGMWRTAGLLAGSFGAMLALSNVTPDAWTAGLWLGTLLAIGVFVQGTADRVVTSALAFIAAALLAHEASQASPDWALTSALVLLALPLFVWLVREGHGPRRLAAAAIAILCWSAFLFALAEVPTGYFEWSIVAIAPILASAALLYAAKGPVLRPPVLGKVA